MKDEEKTKEELICELEEIRQQFAEYKQTEMTQQKQLQIAHKVLDNLPIGVFILDGEGRPYLANKVSQEIVGKGIIPDTNTNQLGEVYQAFFSGTNELYPTSQMPIVRALAGESCSVDNMEIHQNENVILLKVVATPVFNDIGHVEYAVAVFHDITESKRIEDELQESERKYRSVVDALDEGVVFQLADGSIRACNKSAERILGLTADQMMGRTSLDPRWRSIHEDGSPFPGETHPMVHTLNTGERTSNVIMGIHHPTGELKWISITCNPLFHKGENLPYGAVSSFTDITERKQLETQLRQSHKMEAIGILTGGIAHEFNNLLSPILGYTEMLMSDKSEDDSDLNELEQIQIAGNRAKRLVQQMLAYGRQSLSQLESVDLETLLEDTLKLIKNTIPPNISIKKEIEVDLPPILGMPSEVHQVLLNLCINASQAMPDGGELMIRLKKDSSHQFINAEGQKREGAFIALSVQDRGTGMDQATLDRIFDPFFTTKEVGQGTGLGLSVVQGIVEQHRGHIQVDSKVGEGSTFHIYLPVAQKKVTPSVVKTEALSKGNERILLIDDEPMIINLTKKMLEKLGYKVIEFLDCVEAMKWFTDYPQDFDLVIADYGMQMMNGKQVAEKIKKVRPDIPIILFTGYGDLVPREDIGTWGMDDLLMKPFDLKQLSESVRGVLGQRPAEA